MMQQRSSHIGNRFPLMLMFHFLGWLKRKQLQSSQDLSIKCHTKWHKMSISKIFKSLPKKKQNFKNQEILMVKSLLMHIMRKSEHINRPPITWLPKGPKPKNPGMDPFYWT